MPDAVTPALCRSLAALTALLLAGQLGACNRGPLKPAVIAWSEDSCAECRMAVSDRKFAAQVVNPDGTYRAFDDPGCLVEYARHEGIGARSTAFVMDFATGEWVGYRDAYYVYARTMPTPMSYGIACFASAGAASTQLAQYPGKLLRWEELLVEFKP